MSLEYVRPALETLEPFFKTHEREALKTFYDFSVIWHEATYGFAAMDGDRIVGAATLRVYASLGEVQRVVVDSAYRRRGIGRALLERAADVANYYNCHKMTILVPHQSAAQAFFEACEYHAEAVLPQHTFKLDMAVMRKFLL